MLVPGGRIGLTVWGHIKASPGAWALAPFALAAAPKVRTRRRWLHWVGPAPARRSSTAPASPTSSASTSLRVRVRRPGGLCRALASTGPAFEAIQAVGEESFLQAAVELARRGSATDFRSERRLRWWATSPPSPTAHAGDVATAGAAQSAAPGFSRAPAPTPEAQRLFDDDLQGGGYVTNVSRLWAYLPTALDGLSDLMGQGDPGRLPHLPPAGRARDGRGVGAGRLVLLAGVGQEARRGRRARRGCRRHSAARTRVSTRGAGAGAVGPAGRGRPKRRHRGRRPGAARRRLRRRQIFAITTFVALRLAFSTVNDALGARPDRELADAVPEPVRRP